MKGQEAVLNLFRRFSEFGVGPRWDVGVVVADRDVEPSDENKRARNDFPLNPLFANSSFGV